MKTPRIYFLYATATLFSLFVWSGSPHALGQLSDAPPPSLDELDSNNGPVAGVEILEVVPGSQAEALGIQAGQVVIEINGEPVYDDQDLSRRLYLIDDRELVLVDRQSKRIIVQVDPGVIGIRHLKYQHRLTLAVSRAMARDAAWNQEMIAAAWALEHNRPGAAATAFAAAVSAGYPEDLIHNGLAYRLAVVEHRLADALKLLKDIPLRSEEHPYLPSPQELYPFLLAAGQTADLYKLVREHPKSFPFTKSQEWPFHARLLSKAENIALPAEHFPPYASLLTPTLHGAANWHWGGDLHTHDFVIIDGIAPWLNVRPGNYKQAFLTRNEDVGDFSLDAEFTVSPTGTPHPTWVSNLLVNVADYDEEPTSINSYFNGERSVLGLKTTLSRDSPPRLGLLHGWDDYLPLDDNFFDGEQTHQIQITRRGGHGRIVLNGKVILDRPVDEFTKNLVFHVHVVGLEVKFTRFKITEPMRNQ